MKSILFLAIILFFKTSLFGQDYNQIIFEKTFVNRVPLGANKTEVIRNFGRPQKIRKDKDISEDGRWSNYYYKNSIVMISLENTFRGFTILDTSFTLKYNKITLKIGDKLNMLQKYFPDSYMMFRKLGGDFQVSFKDRSSFLVFILKNGAISEIHTWEDI